MFFIMGCIDAHVGHWKSANSSTVTDAVADPSILGGWAPRGAFAGVPCVFATVGLVFGPLVFEPGFDVCK